MEITLFEIDSEIESAVRAICEKEMIAAIQVQEKHAREDAINAVKEKVLTNYEEEEADEETIKQVIMY